MKMLGFAVCVIILAFSKVHLAEDTDDSYQCDGEPYEFDASVVGEVTSPFYGKRQCYHDNLLCQYRIRAPEGYRIKITFKDLDIVPSSLCKQDKLIVFSKNKMRMLRTFCGTELPYPMLSRERENEIWLIFETDIMAAGRGFKLQYESSPNMELCGSGYDECKNRNCYDIKKKCDGIDDCGDATDETNCGFPLIVEPEECGTPSITPNTIHTSPDRMVGGEIVIPNSFPWQVSVQYMDFEPTGHFCGGILINAQWVVTAAHCAAKDPYYRNLRIHVGAHYKFKKSKYEQIRTAYELIAYPQLTLENIRRYSMTHDIALIKLNAPVKFTAGVHPACLPFGLKPLPGWQCYATGWGETKGTGGNAELKQQLQIVQSNQTCKFDQEAQICASQQNQSPCYGDSGGPLQCKRDEKWFVFGIVSYGTNKNDWMAGLCAGEGASAIYANVADKTDWIRTTINKYS